MKIEHVTASVLRWLSKPWLGGPIALLLLALALGKWSTSWVAVRELATQPGWLALGASAMLYVFGLIAIATAIALSLGNDRWVFAAALAGQLFKYAPGVIWQAAPTASERSVSGYLAYGLVTLQVAAMGLLLSRHRLVVVIGLSLCVPLAIIAFKRLGLRSASQVALFSVLAVLLLAGSGAAVSRSYGLDPISWGRDLLTAWSLGVLTVPIPAGLGVREFVLTSLSPGDTAAAALLATTHRTLTIAGDILVGLPSALLYLSKARRRTKR